MSASICSAASANRSVPVRQLFEVITTPKPADSTTSAIRVSSVATNTSLLATALQESSATHKIIGLPRRFTNGFPGYLDDEYRAGIKTTVLMLVPTCHKRI